MTPSDPTIVPGAKQAFYQRFDERYYTTDGYDDYLTRFEAEAETDIIAPLFALIDVQPSWSFLDVGCGMGGTILALRRRGFSAEGTEVSPFCLTASPAKEWMRFGEASALPYADTSFDVVLCNDMFQYLTREEIRLAAAEFVRVARQFIVFSAIHDDSPNASQQFNPDHLRQSSTPSIGEMRDAFLAAGARVHKDNAFGWDFTYSCIFSTQATGTAQGLPA